MKWLLVIALLVPLVTMTAMPDGEVSARREGVRTVWAVGDIADCTSAETQRGAEQTAALLAGTSGPILGLGDYAYPLGTETDFAECFDPVWGSLRSRIIPTAGNHDFGTGNSLAYHAYFGAISGTEEVPWFTVDVGGWHIVSVDTNWCPNDDGCAITSAQGAWFDQVLSEQEGECTIVIGHHPRWSSGMQGNSTAVEPLWEMMARHGVELYLVGHDHDYERFAPMDRYGDVDRSGVREVVVGTGGLALRPFETRVDGSQVRQRTSLGALRLTLRRHGYRAEFVPVAGETFTDRFSGRCH